MKTLASLAAGLSLLVLPAAAQPVGGRLSPPLNVVQAQTPQDGAKGTEVTQRQSMVIEEDGTVRFLTPAEAAELFVSRERASEFNVEIDQHAGASPDGDTRILRVVPEDGSPSWLITITKD